MLSLFIHQKKIELCWVQYLFVFFPNKKAHLVHDLGYNLAKYGFLAEETFKKYSNSNINFLLVGDFNLSPNHSN